MNNVQKNYWGAMLNQLAYLAAIGSKTALKCILTDEYKTKCRECDVEYTPLLLSVLVVQYGNA